jgi:tetratricopeptide (TPR) repeat protein
MLLVAIHGQDPVIAMLIGVGEGVDQALAIAAVFSVAEEADFTAGGHFGQEVGRSVRAGIIDDQDVVGEPADVGQDGGHVLTFVINWNGDQIPHLYTPVRNRRSSQSHPHAGQSMVEPVPSMVNHKPSNFRAKANGLPHPFMAAARLACLLVALGFLLAGCVGPSPTPPPPRISGLDSYVAGAEAYDAGDTARARVLLEQAVRVNPNLTMARQLLGDIYRRQKDYRRAIEEYEAASRLDPYGYKNQYDLAVTYQFLDRLEDAVAAYLRALKLAPRDLNSNMNLGLVYLALGKTNNALAQLKKAVQISPDSAEAQCNYGVALDAAGQLGKAETAYQRALELNPNETVALMNLGINLLHQGRQREAEPVLARAARKLDTPLAHQRYGDALVLEHRDDDALVEYQIALQRDPRYFPAMNQIGMILIRRYEAGLTLDESLRREAVAMWRQSLLLRPDQPPIQKLVDHWDQGGKLIP